MNLKRIKRVGFIEGDAMEPSTFHQEYLCLSCNEECVPAPTKESRVIALHLFLNPVTFVLRHTIQWPDCVISEIRNYIIAV